MYTSVHRTMLATRAVDATIMITSSALVTLCVCNHLENKAVFCKQPYHICELGNGHFKIHSDRVGHIFHWPDELVVLGEEFVKQPLL